MTFAENYAADNLAEGGPSRVVKTAGVHVILSPRRAIIGSDL